MSDWTQATDDALIAACLAADKAAWGALVRRYERLVYSVAIRSGLDEHAAEDVTQDVFIALLKALPSISNRAAVGKWLITTTARHAWKANRQSMRTHPVDQAEPSTEPDVRDWMRTQEISAALARLGGRCEELLIALYGVYATPVYEHLAQRLGMPVGSIGPTRARCLEKLVELLDESDSAG